MLNALLIFGRSIVALGTKHCKDKRICNLCKYLPATFIGYAGQEDYFKVISTFDRFIATNIYYLRKRSLAKSLISNGERYKEFIESIDALKPSRELTKRLRFHR